MADYDKGLDLKIGGLVFIAGRQGEIAAAQQVLWKSFFAAGS